MNVEELIQQLQSINNYDLSVKTLGWNWRCVESTEACDDVVDVVEGIVYDDRMNRNAPVIFLVKDCECEKGKIDEIRSDN